MYGKAAADAVRDPIFVTRVHENYRHLYAQDNDPSRA